MSKRAAMVKAILSRKVTAPVLHLSTGATLLNLGLTDCPEYGLISGHYYFLVGDSSSGKTWISLSIFAEAAYNSDFDNYRLIHDNVEDGALMDVSRFFGKKTMQRIEPPRIVDGLWVCSDTVEDFYDNIDDAIKVGKPFIYLLDSQDALTSTSSNTKFDEQKKARKKGKESTGSFGDGKAKIHSENIRRALSAVHKSGSILIVVSQSRDNLGFGFEKKTRSGGRALKFYATSEIWTSIKKQHKQEVRGAKIKTGIDCKLDMKKNRITGDEPSIVIPIMNNVGIDDVGSMIDYLVETEHWPVSGKGSIVAEEFDQTMSRKKLIQWIEEEQETPILQRIVGRVWNEIKAAARPARKSRYAILDE